MNGPMGATLAATAASSIFLIESLPSSWARQISLTPRLRMRLTTKPGDLLAHDRLLADRLGEVDRRADRVGLGVVALDDLHQRQHRGRVEVVEAADLLGPQRGVADLGDRQRGGVRGQDRVAGGDRVELAEDGLLDLHALGHRLDDEVDIAEALVAGGAGDAPDDLLDLRVGLLLGEAAPS